MTEVTKWEVRLSASAEADFRNIVRWTSERFGRAQARVYAGILSDTIEALAEGPGILGAKERDEIASGLFTIHVSRKGHQGRHFVMYRVGVSNEPSVIEVLRVLHDSMDLPRHRPPAEDW